MSNSLTGDWLTLRRDNETGIESVHAHFCGHAYDPHDHDEMLVGVTHMGVQRFNCHRRLHTSTPGQIMLIEPGAVHDGHAPNPEGFTYSMLYLPQSWLNTQLQRRGLGEISALEAAFRSTLMQDDRLNLTIQQAFSTIHGAEGRLARDQNLDRLVDLLSRHLHGRPSAAQDLCGMLRVRDFLHESMTSDIGLDDVALAVGLDRFRLTRQFKQAFGQSPHAYLVRLRLKTARALLAQGCHPAQAAAQVGFADQSHLGRWFRRAYRITPAAYQQQCTNVLYRQSSLR
ncbi:AraC-like DNA-binding protein [Erwinia persicina]|jgi:AraC-like DNA-binding protein|uniref:AraC family ligand binding domain-containing protein n=1 Tax=Erwinia plantamica TaxID=3237104 RepID=A0ABW7CKP1_9GAMM|nr:MULTISPECIES: AraC family transcriptional regulator [Erwinia]MCP1437006.1 AraC-like DNA-binding protein [Erwinia persicina]RRZ89357.1 AraC family transcriptional regulator [Erwinia sp. 198]